MSSREASIESHEKRAARRERYLEAAQDLFAEHGFVGTSMDMIVARAGGSKATLYRYFPSKDALIAGLMDAVASAITHPPETPEMDDLPLREALMTIGMRFAEGVASQRAVALVRLCLGEYGRFPELSRVVWDHGPAVTYANFQRFIGERERKGELVIDDLQLASEQFIAGIVGHIQMKVAMGIADAPSPEENRRRVTSAVETFLARYGTAGA